MVTFLECIGPNTLNCSSNCQPDWSKCPYAEPKPCPFCSTNNLNQFIGKNQPYGQCRNLCCCCSSNSPYPVVPMECCCCCQGPMCGRSDTYSKTNYFRCPWCTGRLMIIKLEDDSSMHQYNQPGYISYQDFNTNNNNNSNNSTTLNNQNMQFGCKCCGPLNGNQNSETNPYEKACNTNQNISVDIQCEPKVSKRIIGGKLVTCPYGRKNGLQDQCVL